MQLTAVVSVVVLLSMYCQHPAQEEPPVVPEPLVINEFMADNRGTVLTDEAGEPDDWFELYNRGTEVCSTGMFYCSDDSTRLYRYRLPDTALPPGGYLLVWADGDPEQGRWHAPFRLSAEEGDEIILTAETGTVIDRIQFFAHNNNPIARVPDESYGRSTDGDTLWVQQFTPSPGSANVGGRTTSP